MALGGKRRTRSRSMRKKYTRVAKKHMRHSRRRHSRVAKKRSRVAKRRIRHSRRRRSRRIRGGSVKMQPLNYLNLPASEAREMGGARRDQAILAFGPNK